LNRKEEALRQFELAVELYEPFGKELLDAKDHKAKIDDPVIGNRLKQWLVAKHR
jgi:hypothetical protein